MTSVPKKKVKFFQPRKLGTFMYPKGVCAVPEKDCQGWFYEELLAIGDITEMSDTARPTAIGSSTTEGRPGATSKAGGPPKPGGSKQQENDTSDEELEALTKPEKESSPKSSKKSA